MAETEKKRSRFFNQKDKEFARSVNILSYLQACGEQFEEVSSGTYQHTDHDSLRYNIRKNVLNHFSDTNSKAAFNCIDAAILMYGFTYSEAVHDIFKKSKLIPEGGIQQTFYSKPKNFDYNRDVKEVEFPKRAYRYLTEERGLNKKLIDFCIKDGTIAGDTRGNVVFKWKDMKEFKSNKLVGASIRGTRIIPEKDRVNPKMKYFRKILAGSQTNAGYYFDLGIPEKLVIGEAAIDVLSYISRKINSGEKETLKNTRFASMEGLKDKTFLNQFTAVNHIQQQTGRNKTPSVLFIVDNDQPGQDFIFKMENLGDSFNFGDRTLGDYFSYEMVPSVEMENGKLMKDQNDLLLYTLSQNKEINKDVNMSQQQSNQKIGGR
ncbi:DUF3991 domain-containing protein [Listeria cossartiae subsp. cayugensis]|uniref:DUF3991 domain-containing protein n=1 Tax=Listeria cossartiae subsp. cayugensis TaxID=2713505 RepID=A0ABU2IRG5_9LIST|nr:DUF3991 domain-containing protein [Listeria cossartiae]MDT0067299.1 DUF3991 domain-containing protein [Listeria cossartiae subsp. cayugensis]MDT0081146.1 DUF3991 domain-containing protein [Listeria cossartiae subsp. cayugensis]MDT0083982.1 DUF3991 domain-containing protein [Listeria cossartiae subsp. cayugensis]MDT0089550.1 DUF3991 domain-containing protein [Listeria cossartiae subsp. cayugensis]MDT0100620.1 DUF3991 domain-containing protein [Listeria cossartiae subsp. cayugensis]